MANSAKLFSSSTEFFQKNKPLVHLLFSKLGRLVIKIINRICKKLCNPSSVSNPDNLLPYDYIILSEGVREKLAPLRATDAVEFRKNVQQHYMYS